MEPARLAGPVAPAHARSIVRVLAWGFALMTVLTAMMTYPQVLMLSNGLPDVGDPLLNTWALAWVAHQLPIAPARLFDGNIFFPERLTLAYSEALVVPGLMAAPLHWLGLGPILVYNLVFLSAIVCSGVGVMFLVRELTGHTSAGIVSGIVFAFLPFRIDHISHLQLQLTQWIPLTMWALHRVVQGGRPRDGVLLGVFAACQILSCVYFGVFLLPYAAVMAVVLVLAEWRVARRGAGPDLGAQAASVARDRTGGRRRLVAFALAGLVYAAITAPTGLAYVRASRVVGERHVEEVKAGSATLGHYLATGSKNAVYGRWSETFGQAERRLFPGAIAIVLALVGLWRPRSSAQVGYGLTLLLAFDMSLGFNGLTYPFLWEHVLPFRGLRVPARMGLFVGFSLAVLAGFGVVRVLSVTTSPTRRRAIVAGIALVALAEYRSHPLGIRAVPTDPPPIYADLLRDRGDSPRAAIVELPIAREDPTYMYYSTFHWENLLNGYSGFHSPAYFDLLTTLGQFPDAASLEALRRRGTRYVVIHGELLEQAEYAKLVAAVEGTRDFTLVSRRPWLGREMSLYRLMPATSP